MALAFRRFRQTFRLVSPPGEMAGPAGVAPARKARRLAWKKKTPDQPVQ